MIAFAAYLLIGTSPLWGHVAATSLVRHPASLPVNPAYVREA